MRAYPARDSNPHPPRSEHGVSSIWTSRAKLLQVDRRRIELRRSCLQGSSAHQCSARGAGGRARTDCLPLTRRVRLPAAPRRHCALGATRTRTVRPLRSSPLPLGYEGMGTRSCERKIRTSTNGFRDRRAAWLHQLAPTMRMYRGRDSNPHCARLDGAASCRWATAAPRVECWGCRIRTRPSEVKARRPAASPTPTECGSEDSNPVYACLEGRCPTGWATTACIMQPHRDSNPIPRAENAASYP